MPRTFTLSLNNIHKNIRKHALKLVFYVTILVTYQVSPVRLLPVSQLHMALANDKHSLNFLSTMNGKNSIETGVIMRLNLTVTCWISLSSANNRNYFIILALMNGRNSIETTRIMISNRTGICEISKPSVNDGRYCVLWALING